MVKDEGRLTLDVRLHYRDQFREARALALGDAERFQEIIFVVERLGAYVWQGAGNAGLGQYKNDLVKFVKGTATLSYTCDEFETTYELVRKARNDALHQGAFARHLTSSAAKLAIMLEEALMGGACKVKDFMVVNPLCAERWQPLSRIRQLMLANSFSYLPLRDGPREAAEWQLISEFHLAIYLRENEAQEKKALRQSVKEAEESGLSLASTEAVTEDMTVVEALKALQRRNGRPVVVVASQAKTGPPVGILTPFDLL